MNDQGLLVVGASRGIGLALVAEKLRSSSTTPVIATHRQPGVPEVLRRLALIHPERLLTLPLDVTDNESIDSFAQKVAGLDEEIGTVIHAAGILHEQAITPEKSLDQCAPERLMRYFQVNSVAPLMIARALLPLQSRKSIFTFAALSAMVGSIGDNRRGGWYGYRASKAALNQFIRTLAIECRMRFPKASVVALHPGTTDTCLSKPFQKNIDPEKLYSKEQTARRLLKVLSDVDAGKSGCFLNWDGTEIPW